MTDEKAAAQNLKLNVCPPLFFDVVMKVIRDKLPKSVIRVKLPKSAIRVKLPKITFHLLFLTSNDLWMFCVCVVLLLYNSF